ncbi:[protein-PII] uridylyltransferase, partial [Myxococcota bacterium]|nr:[protein-PII] uridylyltransferase [Myxococcota bacterium]
VEHYVHAILYGLWDLGFEVGHAVRTVDECVDAANADHSVKTGLLDARLLTDDGGPAAALREETYRALVSAIERELSSPSGAAALVAQKLEESARRRERFGNSVYLLEPNVKASVGGLRELHTALWIARVQWRAKGLADLVRFGVLSPREGKALERAYGFLLRVRTELHLAAGRRQDVLGFEPQESIAKTLGYLRGDPRDHDAKKHGVERFMRAHYFHAWQLRHLSALVVERATSPAPAPAATPAPAPGGFVVANGTLTVASKRQFHDDPAALVRIFRVAQEEGLSIYSYTKDLIRDSASLVDRRVRRDPRVIEELLAIFEDPKGDGAILDELHDLGILRRLMPEVSRMTAKWQHSLYHVYTVDVHSLFVVKHLKALRAGAYAREHPELTRLVADLPRPAVLYVAGFLHDIGKGWNKGDHSGRGAVVARVIGRRFEEAGLASWTAEETADLEWLVREHLTMSDISQRRDVSDHDLIESFAASCATAERLEMSYLLTFADMKGTSPKVWTDWKATLLHEVYEVTRAVLESPGRTERGEAHVEARRRRTEQDILDVLEARALASPTRADVAAFAARMPPRYMLSIPSRRMLRHVELWREVGERGRLALHVRAGRGDGSTRLTIACPDRPGLLALLAGTLAANRLAILSAQIFSIDLDEGAAHPGRAALDVLYVKDESGGAADDPARWARVKRDLEAVLFEGGDVEQLLAQRLGGSGLAQRPKPAVKTEIVVANDVSRTETVIDVFCQDRLGVLYTVARALADAGLDVSVAKISTQGDRVADGFYVTDAKTKEKLAGRERLDALKAALRAAIDART